MRDDEVDGVQTTIAELMRSSVGRRWWCHHDDRHPHLDHPGTYTVTVTATSSGGTSTTQDFTGQTIGRNGGPQATATATITVPAAATTIRSTTTDAPKSIVTAPRTGRSPAPVAEPDPSSESAWRSSRSGRQRSSSLAGGADAARPDVTHRTAAVHR